MIWWEHRWHGVSLEVETSSETMGTWGSSLKSTDVSINERIYHVAPSSLNGLGLCSRDDIKVCYRGLIELMEYERICYNYNGWVQLVQYTKSMCRYGVDTNYIQLKDNNQNKGTTTYIGGRPKEARNIVVFITCTWPMTINKQPNCIFEGCEGNHVFVCAIKSIAAREEFLIDYNLNQIDTNISIMGVACIQFYRTRKQCLLYVMTVIYYNILLGIL